MNYCSVNDIIKHLKKEALQMGKINQNTYKRNMDALKRLKKKNLLISLLAKYQEQRF